MAKDDGLEPNRDGFSCRIRAGRHPDTGKSQQLRVTICVHDREVARVRKGQLERMSRALCAKDLTRSAAFLLKKAASCSDEAAFRLCLDHASSLAPKPASASDRPRTFKQLGELWTSGRLHSMYPAYVKDKASSDDDESRLGWLYRTIGDVPLTDFGLAEAMLAMGNLPPTCRRPATQRAYAQCIARVLRLAVFPCQLIREYPLPRGFLPKLMRGEIRFPYLYPDEELQLMRTEPDNLPKCCRDRDDHLLYRALFGTLNREGMRVDEALGMEWRLQDFVNGVINIGPRKNGRSGEWKANEGTLEALEVLKERFGGVGPFERLPRDEKYAVRVRQLLLAAGVDRHALHHNEPGRRRLRAHDLRSTFVTLALAWRGTWGDGRAENWVSARTGHLSSQQINGYKRQMEGAVELGHTDFLVPLDVALGLRVLADTGEIVGPREGVTEAVTDEGSPVYPPGSRDNESSRFDAGTEGRGRTGTPLRAADFESAQTAPELQIPGVFGAKTCSGPPAVTPPAAADVTKDRGLSGGLSHPAASYVEQLQAAAHAALSEHRWEDVAALGKLIEQATAGTRRAPAEESSAPRSASTSALTEQPTPRADVVELSSHRRERGK